jgi:glucan 1,3-beta-glucosidase
VELLSSKMNLCSAGLFLFVLGIQGIQFEPSTVGIVVSEIKDRYSAYIKYNGTAAASSAIPANDAEASILPRQSTAYWYEEITHQGISAFGPSGYAVYRNVKDYGATGTSEVIKHVIPILKETRQRCYG